MLFRVKLSPELYEYFKKIEKEIEQGDKTNEREYKLIKKGIKMLKQDYRKGVHISKKNRRAYEPFIKKYNITNLWKLNVSKDWRLIYTVQGTEVEVVSVILESLNHKEYDRVLGYG